MFEKNFTLPLCLFFCLLAFSACASTGTGGGSSAGGTTRGNLPDWVRDPYTKYDRQNNLAARGSGSTVQAAEKSALGNLVAIFGQSIQVDEKVTTSYQEAVKTGVTANWSENVSSNTSISTSAGMDTLIGAEIGDTWYDGNNEYYAVAVLNKQKAATTYSEMVRTNQAMIDNLVNMPATEKNTLDGFSRYQFAATIADITTSYRNVLTQIGAPVPVQGNTGDYYRAEAQNITKAIPVGIRVKNDKAGRIEGAFAKVFSDLGFRSGGNNSRYTLDVDITVSPVDLPNNTNKFARIVLDAKFTDNGITILPYNFADRDGHLTLSEAENRVYMLAERKINAEYKNLLSDYLSRLLPQR